MKLVRTPHITLGFTLALTVVVSACSGNGTETSTTSTGGTTGTGGATMGTSHSGTTTTTTSTGTGGSITGAYGPGASALVNGGEVCQSPSYRMVITVGQPTQNQTKTTSPGYQMQGGLIGAMGTLP